MARYDHLPIWKDAVSLAVLLEEAVRRFPRREPKPLCAPVAQPNRLAAGRRVAQKRARRPTEWLGNRFEPRAVASYAGQQRWFARRFRGCIMLVQKGWEYEIDAGSMPAASRIDIAPRIPATHLPRLLAKLRRTRQSYVVVAEDGYLKRGLKRRVLQEIGWPTRPADPKFASTP